MLWPNFYPTTCSALKITTMMAKQYGAIGSHLMPAAAAVSSAPLATVQHVAGMHAFFCRKKPADNEDDEDVWKRKIIERLPQRWKHDPDVICYYEQLRPWRPSTAEESDCDDGGHKAFRNYCHWHRECGNDYCKHHQRRHFSSEGKPKDKQGSKVVKTESGPVSVKAVTKKKAKATHKGHKDAKGDKKGCFLGPFCALFKKVKAPGENVKVPTAAKSTESPKGPPKELPKGGAADKAGGKDKVGPKFCDGKDREECKTKEEKKPDCKKDKKKTVCGHLPTKYKACDRKRADALKKKRKQGGDCKKKKPDCPKKEDECKKKQKPDCPKNEDESKKKKPECKQIKPDCKKTKDDCKKKKKPDCPKKKDECKKKQKPDCKEKKKPDCKKKPDDKGKKEKKHECKNHLDTGDVTDFVTSPRKMSRNCLPSVAQAEDPEEDAKSSSSERNVCGLKKWQQPGESKQQEEDTAPDCEAGKDSSCDDTNKKPYCPIKKQCDEAKDEKKKCADSGGSKGKKGGGGGPIGGGQCCPMSTHCGDRDAEDENRVFDGDCNDDASKEKDNKVFGDDECADKPKQDQVFEMETSNVNSCSSNNECETSQIFEMKTDKDCCEEKDDEDMDGICGRQSSGDWCDKCVAAVFETDNICEDHKHDEETLSEWIDNAVLRIPAEEDEPAEVVNNAKKTKREKLEDAAEHNVLDGLAILSCNATLAEDVDEYYGCDYPEHTYFMFKPYSYYDVLLHLQSQRVDEVDAKRKESEDSDDDADEEND